MSPRKIPAAVDRCEFGITDAAELIEQNWATLDRPLLPTVRREFGLSLLQAVAAIREANARRDTPIS